MLLELVGHIIHCTGEVLIETRGTKPSISIWFCLSLTMFCFTPISIDTNQDPYEIKVANVLTFKLKCPYALRMPPVNNM